jgi:hypothetical protein
MSKIISILLLATIASTLCHDEFLKTVNGAVEVVAKDVEDLVVGFYSGLGIFSSLPHQKDCINKAIDPVIVEKIQDIVSHIKALTPKSDFVAVMRQISGDVTFLLTRFQETQKSCVDLVGDYKVVFHQLVTYISNPEYIQKIGQHAILNIGGFTDRAQQAVDAFKVQNFLAAGNIIGDLIHFGLFWDFKVQF